MNKSDEYALSQEANSRICYCRFEEEMMGKVPEGSFCPFCAWRRYESVIVKIAQLEAGNEILMTVLGDIEEVFMTHDNTEIDIDWIERKVKKALRYVEDISVASSNSPE